MGFDRKHTGTGVLSSQNNQELLVALESFIDAFKERQQDLSCPKIPLSAIACSGLGVLEAAIKYLKENKGRFY